MMKKLFLFALSTLLLCVTQPLNAQTAFSMADEAANQNTPDGWTAVQLPTGLPEITAANTFDITTYGASTTLTDNTTAIQAALDAAASAGGGMVVIPAGTFLTGCLQMGSKTVLHISAGATLKMLDISTFTTDDNGYYKMENPFITGKSGASDIVIEGESRETSVIDGQGAPWWDQVETAKAASKSTTRSALIRFWQGSRYLFRNFLIQNAPNTNICIGKSGNGSNATAHDITIKNPASTASDPSHNTDGFPIWTQYVNIYNCEIDTGDDNVVTDSGAQFVHVWNCDLKAGHGASLGSYTVNMHDILYEDLTFTDTDCGFRLKSNNDRSGDVYNITFRNCTMTNVPSPFIITSWYDTLPDSPSAAAASPDTKTLTTPEFHGILIQNVTVSGHTTYKISAKNYYGIFIYGRPESKVYDVTFDNVDITHSKGIKMNFCEGIKFYDNCSFEVSNTNNTSKNAVAGDDLTSVIEENYDGAYTWKVATPVTPNFNVTWTMANGETSTAVASADNVVQTSSWAMSSKIEVNSTATYGGNVITKFNPKEAHNPRVERNADYYVEWTFRPFPGYTFTPASVSFDAVKCGTDNPTIDVDFTDGTGVTQKLATDAAINRDGNEVSDSNPAINHSYNITTATNASGNAVTLRIYIGKCTTDKQVALGRIVINGVLNGSLQTYTTVYDLAAAMMTASSNIEGNTGTLAATTADDAANAPELQVDATSGKLGKNNADWAQLNSGTVMTLPGVPKGATITFALYNSTALTINGVAYTNGQAYTTSKDENVVMTCSTGGYIKSITVEGTAFVTVTEEVGYTNTWYFGKSNGAEEFTLQGSAEYTYTVNDHSLVINTASGKLNNNGRTDQWAQCNNGTLFKVPVFAGAKLSWGRYNSGSETGFTINGQLFNEYYIATEEGTVEMTATGISYLSYIKIEPVTLFEVSGTISGGDINGKAMILTAADNGQKYSATVASDAFTLSVPGGTYTPELGSDVTFVISSPETVIVSEAGSIGAITISAATAQTVTGAITNAPAEAFTLTFTGASHTESVSCDAGATTYTKNLMPDTYVISSSVGTLSPLSQEAFTVVAAAVSHNIYFPEAAVPAATSANITVDNTLATASANNYKTVTDALAAAKAGSISNPVVTLTSGQTYREQVIVDQANVTLKTNGEEKATITWYYGIGYSYYSLDANGLYDKDRAMTRNSIKMVDPARWGAAVLVKSTGNNFKAENIVFENSFNQYYTEEELTDGVTPNGAQSITYDRTLTSGQTGYKAADARDVTERAAAIAFENNPTGVELYNCVFRGSQDTFYSSGKIYVKKCNIIGNTDYIFGGGYVAFDDCDLTIGGYSDKSASAYITAYKDGNTLDASKKYVFRDCTVKATDRDYVSANLGRDWGGAAASVYFFNLKNEIGDKLSYTWNNMGGGVSAGTADLHIYDFNPTVNANYSTTGSAGANINGVVSDEVALSLYTGVVTSLGFTPVHVYDIPLNENSYYNTIRIKASNGGTGNITLTRSIAADKWNTIVLPFAMTSSQLKTAFGENVSVAELTDGNESTLGFTTVTETEANKPYAIKVDNAFSSADISNVTIADNTPTQAVSDWQFVGTYASTTVPAGSYYFKNNALWQAGGAGTTSIKPFRAYFTYNGSAASALNFIIDGQTTGIDEVRGKMEDGRCKMEEVRGEYYNLAGQRAVNPKKGLYIVNGKKVIIK